jgi:carbon monoxide dehydrogenase subunit G
MAMELSNEFTVGVPVERAWDVLTDVELIAPCMPGAQLQEIEGDEYRGIVKIKVGPITAQYKGAARFLERDQAAHKAVLRAEGRDTRGQGNASATITMTLSAEGESSTAAKVVTDLTITGRVAQFGRGVLGDVSSKLLGQFVDCLESKLLSNSAESPAPAASATPAASPASEASEAAAAAAAPAAEGHGPLDIASEGAAATRTLEDAASDAAAAAEASRLNGTPGPAIRVVEGPEAEPVDLVGAAGAPVAKRLAPAVIGLTFLWLLSIFVRRRRRSRRNRRGG